MALPIPASEVAVGDYSDDYGHVTEVIKESILGKVIIRFRNGTEITPDKDTELIIDQGGRLGG